MWGKARETGGSSRLWLTTVLAVLALLVALVLSADHSAARPIGHAARDPRPGAELRRPARPRSRGRHGGQRGRIRRSGDRRLRQAPDLGGEHAGRGPGGHRGHRPDRGRQGGAKPPGGGGGATKTPTPTSRFTRPVPIGISTGNAGECSAGTIGARVKDGSGHVFALSNNHVYALENKAPLGSQVHAARPLRHQMRIQRDERARHRSRPSRRSPSQPRRATSSTRRSPPRPPPTWATRPRRAVTARPPRPRRPRASASPSRSSGARRR